MLPLELIYTIFALISITYVVCKARNKLIIGLFSFWLFGYPILANPKYEINIKLFNFVLLPNRIILLPLLFIVFFTLIRNISRRNRFSSAIVTNNHYLFYEIWIVLYFIAIFVSEIISYDRIGFRTVIQAISDPLVFLLFYFSMRWLITPKDFDLLLRSILGFAIISSIVGLVQFFVDPGFLRIGVYRWAFGHYIRSNGLFSAEYDQGFFQISSLLICFIIYRNRLMQIIFVLVSSAAVFVTMHRLSWATWGIALIIIGYYKLKTSKYILLKLNIGLLILIGVFSIATTIISRNHFLDALVGRLTANTLIVRMDYYRFAFDVIRNNPFGVGIYWTPYYNQLAYSKGMPFNYENYAHPLAFVVHNGFLSAGVLHGVIGFITFFLFTFGTILFFLGKFRKDSNIFLLPFGMSIIFLMYNLTQDFSDFGSQIMILYGVLLACFASYALGYVNNRNDSYDYHLN